MNKTRVGGRNKTVLESAFFNFKDQKDNYGRPMFKSRFALLRHICKLHPPVKKEPVRYKPLVKKSFDPMRLESANAIGARLFLEYGLNSPTANEVLKNLAYYETFFEDNCYGK